MSVCVGQGNGTLRDMMVIQVCKEFYLSGLYKVNTLIPELKMALENSSPYWRPRKAKGLAQGHTANT